MSRTWAEVNAAVLAVLAEWSRPAARGDGRVPARSTQPRPEVVADRLLGVRRAESLLDRAEVRVLPGTVVTPLALALLRKGGVAVRVASGRDAAAARSADAGEWGFHVAATRHSGLAEALRRHWLAEGWSDIDAGADAAAWVAAADGRGALVVADEASVVAWRANRTPGVRAATAGEVDEAARAIRHLGANLLVVEPATRSIHLIRQLGRTFRAAGAPAAPAWDDTDGEDGR